MKARHFIMAAAALFALAACGQTTPTTETEEPAVAEATSAADGEACEGFPGTQCANATSYCAMEVGVCASTADASGTCTPRPAEICTTQYLPVCGCDQRTYSNACEAARAGINVAETGECAQTPTQ